MSVANVMEPVAARKMKLGQLLVQEGLVSDQQLEEALHDQETTTPHKPLGEICVDAGFLSTSALKRVIEKYRKQILFGQLLIRMGVVSAAQLDEALSEQEKIGKRVGQILLHKRYITRADITKALSIQLGISNIAPNVYTVDPSLLSKATPEYFRKHRVVPLSRVVTSCGRGREIVTVLMEDPLDMVTIAELEKAFGGEIQPTVSTTIGIEDFLNEVFDAWGRYRVVNETTLRKDDGSHMTTKCQHGTRTLPTLFAQA